MTRLYSPSELAQRLNTGVHTVRRYGDRFSAHLSAGARLRPRRYSDSDAAVLAEAIRLAQDGHSFTDIDTMLAETVDVQLPAVKASEPDRPQLTPALPAELTALSQRLSALEALPDKVTRLEGERQRAHMAAQQAVTVAVVAIVLAAFALAGLVWVLVR